MLISFAYRNVEMRNYFSIDNNVKFQVIPYIVLRQIYMQMIGYTKKKFFLIGNEQKLIYK